MKKLTRNQKIYLAVLGAALLALVFDQVLLSPSSASATEAAAFHPSASPTARAKATASRIPDLLAAVRKPTATLASRFSDVAQAESLDVESINDAMRAPAAWFPSGGETTYVAPVVDPDADKAAEQYRRTHQLNAVMANAQGGYAIVDGRSLRVGQARDDFVLMEVRARSVVLKRGSTVVELFLPDAE